MSHGHIKSVIYNDPNDFYVLKEGWENLFAELEDEATVFASFLWYQSWWKHYGENAKLHLFVMWQRDKIVGIAPLMRKTFNFHGLPVKTVGFIQNNQSLHNDFLVLPEFRTVFLQRLLESLFDYLSKWDVLYFRNMSLCSKNYQALVDIMKKEGRNWGQVPTPFNSPFLVSNGTWEKYFSTLKRISRKNLKNLQNRIAKTGNISVKNITTWDEFTLCKEDLFEVAKKSWSESGGDAMGSSANRSFYESLAYNAAAKGWLSIWTLSSDRNIIAFEFHLKAHGREHALRGHYHSDFASLSPGTYLEMTILEEIFRRRENIIYDFCGAFDSYKKKWTDTYVPHCDILTFNKNFYSRFIKYLELDIVPNLKKAAQFFSR